MKTLVLVAVGVLVLELPATAAISTNHRPRIARASFVLKKNSMGRRTITAHLTICDDSKGSFHGNTRKGPGAILTEERLFRRRSLWAYLRQRAPTDFTPGCFRVHESWFVSQVFTAPGTYALQLRVRDPEGRASNKIRHQWRLT